MGDPKRLRKKYATPIHPWNQLTIGDERATKKEYGLKNKKEFYRINAFLKKYKNIAKHLIARKTLQGEKEKQQIMNKLQNLGLLSAGAQLTDILNLQPKDVFERRLQTLLLRKNLARSIKQARQFITHRHIIIDGKEITAPSYLVSLAEEATIGFKLASTLAAEEHPERINQTKELQKEIAAIKPVKEETKEETKQTEKKLSNPEGKEKSVPPVNSEGKEPSGEAKEKTEEKPTPAEITAEV